MYIYKATIVIPKDKKRPADGKFWALIDVHEDGQGENELVPVTYTSPMLKQGYGGVIAIPSQGARILITKIGKEYFYLSTIASLPDNEVTKGKNSVFDDDVYTDDSSLSKVTTFENEFDAGLKITNKYQAGKITDNVVLKSTAKKMVLLDDSPTNNCIQISTEDHASIKLTSDGNSEMSRGEIDIETQGDISLNSYNGNIEIKIQDTGNEINIINGAAPFPAYNNNVIIPEFITGNVNIVSEYADVNIRSGKVPGQGGIFIKSALGEIVINKAGQITIKGAIGVDVVADGPINLKSTTALNLDAPIINANAGTEMNLYSNGSMAINNSAALASINGITPTGTPVPVHGAGIPAVPAPVVIIPNPLNISDLEITPR